MQPVGLQLLKLHILPPKYNFKAAPVNKILQRQCLQSHMSFLLDKTASFCHLWRCFEYLNFSKLSFISSPLFLKHIYLTDLSVSSSVATKAPILTVAWQSSPDYTRHSSFLLIRTTAGNRWRLQYPGLRHHHGRPTNCCQRLPAAWPSRAQQTQRQGNRVWKTNLSISLSCQYINQKLKYTYILHTHIYIYVDFWCQNMLTSEDE